MAYVEGDNHRIDVVQGHARATVWRRPDLDSNEGARCAEELAEHFKALAADEEVRSMLVDLREAPQFIGPRTQAALGAAFTAFEERRKPLALVTAAAVQALQFQRVLGMNAPLYGRDFEDVDEAQTWAQSFHVG